MAVGNDPAVVDELLALRRSVVAVDRVQFLALCQPVLRELRERRRVVAAVAGTHVHRPCPASECGERSQHLALTIGEAPTW